MNENLTLEQALQLWRDTEEVKNLKAEYCYLADGIPSLDVNKPRQVDCEKFANLFAEDAVFYTSAGEVVEGRDRIREHCRSFQAFPLALHIIATPQIKVDGDNAVGKWHGIVPLITAVDKVAALMVVRYEDHFVPDQRWMEDQVDKIRTVFFVAARPGMGQSAIHGRKKGLIERSYQPSTT